MRKKNNKVGSQLQKGYPEISDRLIECLKEDFPDRLPRKFKSVYELGILVGQQQVIDKLLSEKMFSEESEQFS